MSDSQRDTPLDPRPDGDRDRRRDRVAERTRHLRTIGAAGAIAALGIFTGLAATGDRGGSDGVQEDGAADDANSGRVETLGDLVDDLAGGFFEEDEDEDDGGLLPSLGGPFSSNSGGS